jgi:hypothetical protein
MRYGHFGAVPASRRITPGTPANFQPQSVVVPATDEEALLQRWLIPDQGLTTHVKRDGNEPDDEAADKS